MSMRLIGAALAVGVVACLPLAPPAEATWLGLGDGSYDVTLTCTSSSVIACPSQIQGSLTISGTGASAMNFTVGGKLFSGDPVDAVFGDGVSLIFQNSTITLSPLSFLGFNFDTMGDNGLVADDNWWGYCTNVGGIEACSPATFGSWTATESTTPVPEPATAALFGATLAALGLYRRRRA